LNSTSNLTQKNATGHGKKVTTPKKKINASQVADESEGAAVFLYQDSATGISQKFAFSLRYYIGEKPISDPVKKERSSGLVQLDRRYESGIYSFAANGTS
jgi:hypothetical protein